MTTASDTFNRADANPIGGDWETLWGSDVQIVSNATKASAVGACVAGWKSTTNDFADDQYSQITIGASGDADYIGVVVRGTAASGGSGYYAKWESGTSCFIVKRSAGSETTLGAGLTAAFTAADVMKLVATTNGSNCDLELFKNGSSVGTRTDSTSPLTGGQPGIYFDYENVNASTADSWEAGDGASGFTAKGPFIIGF